MSSLLLYWWTLAGKRNFWPTSIGGQTGNEIFVVVVVCTGKTEVVETEQGKNSRRSIGHGCVGNAGRLAVAFERHLQRLIGRNLKTVEAHYGLLCVLELHKVNKTIALTKANRDHWNPA